MKHKHLVAWQEAFVWTILPAGRAWQKAAGAAFAELGVSLSVAAPVLVISSHGPGVRQKDVADAAGIDPAAVVRSLDQLEKNGILERVEDPQDRRAKTLFLTKKGEQLAADLERILAQVKATIFAEINHSDGELAMRVLSQILSASEDFSRNK